jgi:cation transport ATPase
MKRIFIILLTLNLSLAMSAFAGPKKETKEIAIQTSAICKMCKDRLESNLIYEKDVKKVTLDMKTKILTIKYRADKTNPETLKKAVSDLGYDADEVPADAKAYEALPACCKKDVAPH